MHPPRKMSEDEIRNLKWRGINTSVRVRDMEPGHLSNSINMLEKRIGTEKERDTDQDWLWVLKFEKYCREINAEFKRVVHKNLKDLSNAV
jgi:hypothetical protein